MRIVIDARMLYWTGVGRYTKALLDQLEQLDQENEYVVITRRADHELWSPHAPNFRRVETTINPYTTGEQVKLAGLLRRLHPDLVHFTAANAPVWYRGKQIITIHDLTLLDYDTSRGSGIKKQVRRFKRIPFKRVLLSGAHKSAKIIVTTEYVKSQLVQRFGVEGSKITIIPLAADPNLAVPEAIDEFNLGNEYVLFVGNVYPYKNAGLIVEALALLKDKRPELKVAITSQPDYFRDQLEKRAEHLGVRDRIVFTGRIPDGQLVNLYKHATMYVNPSFSEGFGLQGLESMVQGLPVMAARGSSLDEICGEAAEYFDPHSSHDLAEKLDKLISNKDLRAELIQLGYARAKLFSWEKMARTTLEVYRQIN